MYRNNDSLWAWGEIVKVSLNCTAFSKNEASHLVYLLENAAVFNEGGSKPPASRSFISRLPPFFSPALVPYKLGRVGQGFWVYGIQGLFKSGIRYIAA